MHLSGRFIGTTVNKKTGEIVTWEKSNKIVNTGFAWVASLMSTIGNRPNPITHIGFGTSMTETTEEMTTLGNEVYRSPVTSSWDDVTRELTFSGSIPVNAGINNTVTEAGLFNAETGGMMFDRAVFPGKGIEDDLEFYFDFIVTITS